MKLPEPTPDEERFVSVGGFRPHDAKKMLARLAEAKIDFRAEFDDGISPGSIGSSEGTKAYINIFVEREKTAAAKQIEADLFGEFSP